MPRGAKGVRESAMDVDRTSWRAALRPVLRRVHPDKFTDAAVAAANTAALQTLHEYVNRAAAGAGVAAYARRVPLQDVRVEFVALPAAGAAPATHTTTPSGGTTAVQQPFSRVSVVLPAAFSLRPLLEAFGVAVDHADAAAAEPPEVRRGPWFDGVWSASSWRRVLGAHTHTDRESVSNTPKPSRASHAFEQCDGSQCSGLLPGF